MIAQEEEEKFLPHSLLNELNDNDEDFGCDNSFCRLNSPSTNELSGSSQDEIKGALYETEENEKQLQYPQITPIYLPKNYQLKELVTVSPRQFLVYLCTTKGSSVLQKKLRNVKDGEAEFLLEVMIPCMESLMMDSFANYFCTDLFRKFTVRQRIFVLHTIFPSFVEISQNCYGTHPIQTLICLADTDEEVAIILHALSNPNAIVSLACDKAGNNVLQKIIVSVAEERREYFNNVLLEYFHKLMMNINGICVVKTFISSNRSFINRQKIIDYLNCNFVEVCNNDYGNFAVQYIIECWGVENFLTVYNKTISKNLIKLCIHRCSSHVVEKIMDMLDGSQKKKFIYSIISNEKCYILLDCKYGVCILRKLIHSIDNPEREMMKAWLFKTLVMSTNNNSAGNTERLMKLTYLV